jgi:hypothetical protein
MSKTGQQHVLVSHRVERSQRHRRRHVSGLSSFHDVLCGLSHSASNTLLRAGFSVRQRSQARIVRCRALERKTTAEGQRALAVGMPSETRNGHSRNGRSTPRRRAPVKASGSWIGVGIGAIKSIVSAPLSWFGGVAEREPEAEPDAYGKRRLAVQATTEEDEGEHRKKRKRAQSPEKDVSMTDVVNNGGYNDPPAHLFNQPLPVPRLTSLQSVNSGYGLPRMMPVDPRGSYPSSPVARAGSAAPSDADSGKEFPRTNFTLGVSRDSVVRDYSLPPAPLSVHLDTSRVRPSRLSLTPQPSVFDFAPAGHRRDLSLSERPTLVDLPMSPRRLKRPSEEPAFDDRPRRSMSFQPLGTLDPIIDDRMVCTPQRRSIWC